MKWIELALCAVIGAIVPGTAAAQSPVKNPPVAKVKAPPRKESQESLAREAKISDETATATALMTVPNSTVKGHELERDKQGRVIYQFELKVTGASGTEHVAIDAITGSVIDTKAEKDAPPAKRKGRP